MSISLLSLAGYAGWTIVLAFFLYVRRAVHVVRGEVPANGFPSGQPHGSDAEWRHNRAHINCTENLPIFAVAVLIPAVLGVGMVQLDTLAMVTLASRVCQSAIHLASGSARAVMLRSMFFLTQVICMMLMLWVTVQHGG